MDSRVLGEPPDGPTLSLDHEQFAYAGKFVMSNTGKAVVESEAEGVLAAAAFNYDRTDPAVAWIRYVTTRRDRRGEGIGTGLLADTAAHLLEDADRVRIAVNNPFAYEAAYKAGFGYTGSETGLAELVLQRPGDRSASSYHEGLEVFRRRDDLTPDERAFAAARTDRPVPDTGDATTNQ